MQEINVSENVNEEIEYPIIKISEPEYCKLEVSYEGDPSVVVEKIEEAVSSLRSIKVPGFRPGKAPDYAIKAKLKSQINNFVARSMATQAIDDIVFETDIKPIGQPSFSNVSVNGKKFSCDVEIWKKPEFEVDNFKFEIPKPSFEEDEDSLAEKSLFNLRKRVGEVEPYEEDDAVEIGDQITFSFEAKIDDENFDGSVVEGEMYTVGTNRWKNFDDYLVGIKAGETREFDFVFEDKSELNGKTAKFSVTVHMGTKQKPHPINKEFYEKMGVENIEELMTKLKSISRASLEKSEKESIRNQVAIKLIEKNIFEVPDRLVDLESRNIAIGRGWLDEQFDQIEEKELESIKEQARKNIRLSFILDSIREMEPDSVLNDGEARQHLMNHPSLQGKNLGELMKNPGVANQVHSMLASIKEEFTLQWVADQSTIIE